MDSRAVSQPDRSELDALVARLTRSLAEAIEQQAATSEVLEAIGRSAFELEPVFETVVRHAVQLCGADAGMVCELDGDVLSARGRARRLGRVPPVPRAITRPAGPGTLVGRVGLERRTVQIADAASDPRYQWQRGPRARRLPDDRWACRCSPTTAWWA